jgi:tetratricopeptide (TPR) repeat protein
MNPFRTLPRRLRFACGWCVLILFLFSGCSQPYAYYMVGTWEQKREMKELFHLLDAEQEPGENRFILIQQISNRLNNAGHQDRLILFLTTYVEKNPSDPYNAYYLGAVAAAYRATGAYPMATHYYERILMEHPDLLVAGSSIHYQCLQELLSLVEDPSYKIEYYKELISRFPELIDLGVTYYYLGRTYEDVGEWEQAIRAYQKFLKYPEAEISGVPHAHARIREKVEFYYAGKEWTVADLQQLVAEIKRAIAARSVRRLLEYKAKVNFFTMSWSQQDTDENVGTVFDIGAFLNTSRVRTDPDLDIDSNSGEAFLGTTGWSYRIPTWYLYFRKVDFKPDPEINGRWEWAGIYFGEKL